MDDPALFVQLQIQICARVEMLISCPQKPDFQRKVQQLAFGRKEREAGCAVLKISLKCPGRVDFSGAKFPANQ